MHIVTHWLSYIHSLNAFWSLTDHAYIHSLNIIRSLTDQNNKI